MIEKCANPDCPAIFRRLRDGRVFIKEIEAGLTSDAKRQPRQIHYYWLCNACCRRMTVIVEKGKGISGCAASNVCSCGIVTFCKRKGLLA